MQKSELNAGHRALIDQAIQAVFPDQSWSPVAELGGGLSTSTIYQITLGEHHYSARLTAPDDPHNDLAHEYAVMQAINDLGIAPRLYYASPEAGIVLTDFIAGQPLFPWRGERPPLASTLATLVRTLHQGPPVPRGKSIFDKIDLICSWLPAPFQATAQVRTAQSMLRDVVPQLTDPAHLRPSHGDINPGNLLFADNQLWLIDWASAGEENFYFDLATCTNFFFFRSAEAEAAFLHHYFGRPPTAQEAAHYASMRLFCTIYYGLIFLYMSTLRGTPLLTDAEIATLPTYPAFMDALGTGKESMGDPRSQQRLGFIYLQWAKELATLL